MADRKTKSRNSKSSAKSAATTKTKLEKTAPQDPAALFVGQWNRLVSTTNWDKGRIICQWREALEAADASAAAYSDDAWAELVGGVTGQHVGRLRRTFQRFGEAFDQYEGLYWSHFHAALDWDDAEMWLEGAIQNDWSISQMRGKRWETLGKPGPAPALDEAAAASGEMEIDSAPEAADEARKPGAKTTVKAGTSSAAVAEDEIDEAGDAPSDSEDDDGEVEAPAAKPSKAGKRLAVAVDELPDDLADAFEQFKLAIIGHRCAGWRETTVEAVIECLDALRELTLVVED